MLNPTTCMVKYVHSYLQTKNPCILFLKYTKYIDKYVNIDNYRSGNLSNNFFRKLFKNKEVFFFTIAYYSTLDLCLYRFSSTHAKEILA